MTLSPCSPPNRSHRDLRASQPNALTSTVGAGLKPSDEGIADTLVSVDATTDTRVNKHTTMPTLRCESQLQIRTMPHP
jgi:hypothetical protein